MRFLLFISTCILISCSFQKKQTILTKIDSYYIGENVSEPSGLAFDGKFLFTISDSNNYVYKYNTNGVFIERFKTKFSNLEGISTFKKQTLLLAVESSNSLVEFDYTNNKSTAHKMKFKHKTKSKKSGIEGVSFNKKNNQIYFLNEKKPGALIIANSKNFKTEEEYKLNFASDYSGIFYARETKELWITSDNESLIYRCTLTGEVIETFDPHINKQDKLEGIALDYKNNLLFVVTDSGQELIKYSLTPSTN